MLHFDEIMMISALNKTNTLSWIFIVIVSLQLGRIILTLSKPDFWILELLRQCGILYRYIMFGEFAKNTSREMKNFPTGIFRK
jgi:hypothetical protein